MLHGEGTEGLSFREGRERSAVRIYCLIRNRWRILLQSYQLRTLFLIAPALAVYEIVQLAGVMKKGWARTWLRAAGWIIANPGTIVRRRRAVQHARRVADRTFLVGGALPLTPGLATGGLERMIRSALDRFALGYWSLVRALL